jgi:hypothetical protein
MAQKQVKQSKKDIIDKIIQTLNILVIPVSTIIGIWTSLDAGVYVAAVVAAINGVLECVKLFIKD